MGFEDWIFALHLVFAAMLVGSIVMTWVVVVALYSVDTAASTLSLSRVGMVGSALTVAGLLGAITLGIWLAIVSDDFQVWDGWVIAAIVLWAIATLAIVRSFHEYGRAVEKARAVVASAESGPDAELGALNRTPTGLLLRALASLAVVLIVVDMIWKPGA